jgi:4-hydroxy-tetrahydrodipicolinate synthase
MLEELQRGAVGMMTGFGFPEILVSIYRDFRAGALDRARDTFYRYLPLIRYENQAGPNLPLRKLIHQQRGPSTTPRPAGPTRRRMRRRCSSCLRSSSTWA